MRHENSKLIFDYWNRLRGNRPAPDRREIEPGDIRNILGDTFILEVDDVFRSISFRLAGTRMCSAYGRELKGLGFLALWEEANNLEIHNAVRRVYENFDPITISAIAKTEKGRFVEYEIILLPLHMNDSTSKRVLGTATPLNHEHWLGSDPVSNNRVRRIRSISELTTKDTPSIVTPLHSATPDALLSGRRFGHLTLIKGGAD